MCETGLGIPRISTQIDKRKLNFLCTLVQTPPDMQPKEVFLRRLHNFFTSGHINKQTGYIPDIIRILKNYNVFNFMEKYITSFEFPTKIQWQYIVNDAIARQENYELQVRMDYMMMTLTVFQKYTTRTEHLVQFYVI